MSKIIINVGNSILARAASVKPKHPGITSIRHMAKSAALQNMNLSAHAMARKISGEFGAGFSAAALGTASTNRDVSAQKRATISIKAGGKDSVFADPKFKEFMATAVGGTLKAFQDAAAAANAPNKSAASRKNDSARFRMMHLSSEGKKD